MELLSSRSKVQGDTCEVVIVHDGTSGRYRLTLDPKPSTALLNTESPSTDPDNHCVVPIWGFPK